MAGRKTSVTSDVERARSASLRRHSRHAAIVVAGLAALAVGFLALYGLMGLSSRNGHITEWDKAERYHSVPEYKRHMKRVVISLARRDTSLRLQHEILLRLPEYTEIILLLPESNIAPIEGDLKHRPYRDRVRLVAHEPMIQKNGRFYLLFPDKDKLIQVDTGKASKDRSEGSLWAQDLFEVTAGPEGRIVLLTPDVHKWYCAVGDGSDLRVIRDNTYLQRLSSVGLDVRQLPLVFKGGNLFVDEIGGKRVVLCGGDVLRTTGTARRAVFDENQSDARTTQIIGKALNADTVVVLGTYRTQPSTMYHLDQAVILLSDGVAGVSRIVDGDVSEGDEVRRVRDYLSEVRSALSDLGYKLIDIDITASNLLRCQHYVNAIPYIDAETGRRTILMPVFPFQQTDLDRQLVRKNTTSFEGAGYEVIHVPTEADGLRGGIHCLVNVLE